MSVWPAWKVRENGEATSWFHVRLAFPDGAQVDALAVVREGCVSIEDVRAQPALSLADLTVLADWIEGPLFESCGVERSYEGDGDEHPEERYEPEADAEAAAGAQEVAEEEAGVAAAGVEEAADEQVGEGEVAEEKVAEEEGALCVGPRRARPVWPRGIEGRRLVAQEYRAAQEEGGDPVLAVMSATGLSRRRSLRLIAQARDAGFLTPRHVRRD
ncbi:DUF6214 family protein [Streptomyces sp. NPDC007856]|uniref:DUF6214 family protein n=1 Tax=Streptomyces sp. NPDC007856 TaxID=3364781 RepID=UPI003694A636